jgi:hypothetical protein
LKTLSANLQTEKAALQNAPCYAVRFDAATPIYLSNWDTSFVFDSHTYTPLIPIKKPSIRESGGSVQIGNVDDTFTSLLINGTLKKVDVYIYEIFFGEISEILISGADVKISGFGNFILR